MYTQCPHCATTFPVEPAQLAAARGRLCCGSCGEQFDALERLADQPDRVGQLDAAGRPPVVGPDVDPQQGDLFALPGAPSAPAAALPPRFARRAVRPHGHRGAWAAAALLLAATLGLQIVLAERAELATDARWRPWLERGCAVLGCDLPPWRSPEQLTLIDRSVGPHPSAVDALQVTATFRNDAPWPQPWPLLELTLSDLEGKPIAMRRFRPEEYLGAPPDSARIAPGQTALAQLELADPGKQAVAFAFEFR